jgi:hypothetical protein
MAALHAGAARVPLDPPLGAAMMGYGARTGVARGHHDPLFARALYLAHGSECLILELDLCLIAPVQAESLRARVAARTRVAAERVLIGCIHTHSGPETGLFAALRGAAPPPAAERAFEAAVRAAEAARGAAEPARLGVGRTQARIGSNRSEGPVDPEVLVVRVDRAAGGPLAVLYIHGCHPTVLGHENLDYSADWPGAASRAIEGALPGALAIFALGAHADVDPRTRGLLDLAVAGQSVGAGFEAMEALGRELGEAAAAAAGAAQTVADAPIAAASARVRLPVHGAAQGAAAREAALARARARALEALGLDAALDPSVPAWFALASERTAGLAPDEARPRIAAVRSYLRDRTAPFFAGGLDPEVGVQVLRIGEAALLALPAEATVAVGRDWKTRLRGGSGAVVSIANGWLRYLPHPRDFAEPAAEQRYEIVMSTFVPEAAARLLDAGDALRARLAG